MNLIMPAPKRETTDPETDPMIINQLHSSRPPKKPKKRLQPPAAAAPKTCLSPNAGSRSVVEKHRRQQMKHLYSSLASLLPPLTPEAPQEKLALPALLDRSFDYVKHLKERIEELKKRKEDLAMGAVEVNEKGSELEVNLVTGLNKGFILAKLLAILEQEGAQVLSASYSRFHDRILCSVTSQAFSPRIGIATPRVHERLKILSIR